MTSYTRYVASPDRLRTPLWLGVFKWFVLVLVVSVSLTAGAAVGWLHHTAAQVARNNPQEVQAAKPELVNAPAGRPVNIMIIGSDRRAGQPDSARAPTR